MKAWIGVDFDGTLVRHEPDQRISIGEAIPRMVERVRGWLLVGYIVKIVTARVSVPEEAEDQRKLVEDWCLLYLGQRLEVTCSKDYGMIVLYDDRAVQVITNKGETIYDLLVHLGAEVSPSV